MKTYMNIETGSTGTFDDWWYETSLGDVVNAVTLGEVVEVEQDESGEWVAV